MPGVSIQAILLLGISPRLPFDQGYRTFFEVIAARIAGLMESAVRQQELAQAVKRFQRLSDTNPFGMVIGDLHGNLSYVSPALLATLEYSEAEVNSGKVQWSDLTPPEYAEADARAVKQLRERGSCDIYEKVYVAKSGRRIPLLVGAAVIDSAVGEVAGFLTDLTPLKAAQEALRKANDQLEKKIAERTSELLTEVSDRQRAETALRELTGRLLRTQDEERRHMARELHDHAGQTLTALGLNLAALQAAAKGTSAKIEQLAKDSQQLSDALSKEIRTLSYLLHPPLLDEVGLQSALQWYVDGFSERSKINVELFLPSDFGRLSSELELVIFRVIQESLTNIHRHSGSSSATIYLNRSESAVMFEVRDKGKGISPERQREMAAKSGVGVRGMEERVRQFGGTLKIESNNKGTKVVVTLPLTIPN
jgi:PAS domain S-box-containing protein